VLGPLATRLLNASDAQDVADDLLTLFGVHRWLVTARFKLQPLLVKLGDVVELERTKLDLTATGTNLWRVVGREIFWQSGTVELTLFQ
jgi:hypothetical protein